MALVSLRREERIGLALAVALHLALLAALVLRHAPPPPQVPQPISVTVSAQTGLSASAPAHEDAAAAVAPTAGTPQPAPQPAPAPVSAPAPVPAPAPVASPPPPRVEPLPVPTPEPAPRPVKVARTRPQAVARPVPVAAPAAPPRPAPAARPEHRRMASVKDWSLADPATPDRQPAGASRIGNDFLKGVAGGKPGGKAAQQGAAAIGPEVRSALSGAIARQLKPHWQAPSGVDADKLVTILSWDLNRDGTLAGPPRVVRQAGITDSNRPQAARHAEEAVRAVQLAAPFQLPPEFFPAWKHVASFEFNRTLSQ